MKGSCFHTASFGRPGPDDGGAAGNQTEKSSEKEIHHSPIENSVGATKPSWTRQDHVLEECKKAA